MKDSKEIYWCVDTSIFYLLKCLGLPLLRKRFFLTGGHSSDGQIGFTMLTDPFTRYFFIKAVEFRDIGRTLHVLGEMW